MTEFKSDWFMKFDLQKPVSWAAVAQVSCHDETNGEKKKELQY